MWIAVEAIVFGWDRGTPHQNHNTQVVQLVTKSCITRAVIPDDVTSSPEALLA